MKNKNSYSRSLVGVLLLVFLVSTATLAKDMKPSPQNVVNESSRPNKNKTPKFWQKFINPVISLNKEENVILSQVIKQKTKVVDYFQNLQDDMSFSFFDNTESYSVMDSYPQIKSETKKVHFKLGWKNPEELKFYPMREKAIEKNHSKNNFSYGIGIAFDIF